MRSIVWSAVLATAFGISTIAAAVAGGPHELITALGTCGIIAAVLNLKN